jgi:tetratricopeptide (TPR) repeat protein
LARHLIDRWTRDDTAKGIGYLQQALERDAGFALAWAELSRAYANLAGWGIAMELGRARMAAERALSLEPDLAEGHAMMGRIRILHDRDFRGAEASYARALELAPGNALALRGAGVLASARGQLEKAIELYRHALTQDPLSAASYQNLGLALDAADRFAEAEAEYRRAMELAPQRTSTRGMLSLALLAQGRVEEALGEAQREPDETFRLWGLAIVHHAMGDQAQSREALRELIEKHAEDSACQVAEVHAVRGEADAAFKWLEKGFEQRDPGLSEMKAIRLLRPLHDDARWGALLRRMGLEE